MKKHMKTLKKKFKNYNPRLKEECGVFGISNATDASASNCTRTSCSSTQRSRRLWNSSLLMEEKYHSEKRFGLVGDNFNKEKVLKNCLEIMQLVITDTQQLVEQYLRNVQPFLLIQTQAASGLLIMEILLMQSL